MKRKVTVRRSSGTFKRARYNQSIVLQPTISSTYISKPLRDQLIPRTARQADTVTMNGFMPFTQIVSLIRPDGVFLVLKRYPWLVSFKSLGRETRAIWIQTIKMFGNAPSAVLYRILGISPGAVGAIRRWHIPNWRDLTNQHIWRASSYHRF